jgi:hypothetical protein
MFTKSIVYQIIIGIILYISAFKFIIKLSNQLLRNYNKELVDVITIDLVSD